MRFRLHDNSGSAIQADIEDMRDAERLERLFCRRELQHEVGEAIRTLKDLVLGGGQAGVNDRSIEPADPFRSALVAIDHRESLYFAGLGRIELGDPWAVYST